MMTYFRFLLLSFDEKKQFLAEKGTFLLTYSEGEEEINLYVAGDFLVEIREDKQKRLSEIVSFKGLGRLEKYAQYINIAELNTI